jgi:hypothetical protein
MDRRSARLRQEYLYRKSLEGKQREEYEKRRAVRQALQEGKAVPTHLREQSAALHKQVLLEDDNTAVQRTHIDDEYANLGVEDPRVCPSWAPVFTVHRPCVLQHPLALASRREETEGRVHSHRAYGMEIALICACAVTLTPNNHCCRRMDEATG